MKQLIECFTKLSSVNKNERFIVIEKLFNIHPREKISYDVVRIRTASSLSFDFPGDGRQLYPRNHSRPRASDGARRCPLLHRGRGRFVKSPD